MPTKKPSAPRLKRIDLSKGEKHTCPGINGEDQYLAKINGLWYAGTFSKQWYGWNFDGWVGDTGLQFDAPGFNGSMWEELYKIGG